MALRSGDSGTCNIVDTPGDGTARTPANRSRTRSDARQASVAFQDEPCRATSPEVKAWIVRVQDGGMQVAGLVCR